MLKFALKTVACLPFCWGIILFPAAADTTKEIVCSTFPIYLFTRNVAEGHPGVAVELLLPAETGCPHDYTVSPHDLQKAAGADVVVYNGRGLDNALVEAVRRVNPSFEELDSSAGIDNLLRAAHGRGHTHQSHHKHNRCCGHEDRTAGESSVAYNPHLFGSPAMAAKVVENIGRQLAAWNPQNAEQYIENASSYALDLRALANELNRVTQRLANPRIVTQHDVFDYLARDTALDIVALVTTHPGQEPSAAEMTHLAHEIEAKDAGAIFTEPQYSDDVGRTLAAETGIPAATLDPVATGPQDPPLDYYQKTMRKNMETLKKTLGVKASAPADQP